MEETFTQLETFARSEKRVAMATLVATRGTTPKKEGAKMWVGEGGRVLGSVTIGGCVDAKVIAEAEAVLKAESPRLLKLDLGDEDAWELGLSCGGTVEVLVEQVELARGESAPGHPPALPALYRRIASEVAQGRAACLARKLSDPSRALLILHGGAAEGSLGAPSLDRLALAQAAELIARGTSRAVAVDEEEIFFEVHAPQPQLVLVGAGHVSMPLVPLAKELGFRTTVIDARPRFATRERFPAADELRIGIPSEIVEGLPLGETCALVLTVHDYKVEVPVLRAALQTRVGYVGMLGNRRRGRGVLDLLRQQGVADQDLARVQVPVGLDIGAQTAAEIALSVLAQIVAVRAGRTAGSLAEARERALSQPAASVETAR